MAPARVSAPGLLANWGQAAQRLLGRGSLRVLERGGLWVVLSCSCALSFHNFVVLRSTECAPYVSL